MTYRSRPTALALLTAIFYSAWLIGPWLQPDLDPMFSYVSELSASSMPLAQVFQLTDLVAGALFILVGYTFTSSTGPVESTPSPIITTAISRLPLNVQEWRLNALIHVVFIILGVATIVDSAFPMACPESLLPTSFVDSPLCQTTGTLVHEISSVIASAAAIAVCILAIMLVYPRRFSRTLPLSALGVIFIMSTLYTGGAALIQLPFKGLAQRIGLAAFALWFVIYVGTIGTLNRKDQPS
ncbi:MAG: DUF998 domain-containing protein [Actinomycetaceae bacterium]|nr:DUF998 domain-containing protein [Actinomycetaceae bacterium]